MDAFQTNPFNLPEVQLKMKVPAFKNFRNNEVVESGDEVEEKKRLGLFLKHLVE